MARLSFSKTDSQKVDRARQHACQQNHVDVASRVERAVSCMVGFCGGDRCRGGSRDSCGRRAEKGGHVLLYAFEGWSWLCATGYRVLLIGLGRARKGDDGESEGEAILPARRRAALTM